jgi:uncharacterized protein (TIRG00374 family)
MAAARRRWSRPLLISAGFLVTGIFMYLAVRDAHVGEMWNVLQRSNYWWLLPSLAALAVFVFVRALRWRYLFERATRPPLGAIVTATLLGYFFNNILPARAGEAARIVVLKRQAGTSRAETVSTVVVERAYDVLSLLFLLFISLPWLPKVSWLRPAVGLAIALAFALAIAIVVLRIWGDRPLRWALQPLRRFGPFRSEAGERAAQNLLNGLAGVTRARIAIGAFAWTTLSWIAAGVSAWLAMLAFKLDLSPMAGLFVMIAIGLAMILPSAPGAVGVFEAATVVALGAYGIPDSPALSYAIVLHAVNFVPYLVVGLIVLYRQAGVSHPLRFVASERAAS